MKLDEAAADAPERTGVSIVVPVYNEQDSLAILCERIRAVMAAQAQDYEIIFVDDGSTDASPERLKELAGSLDNVRCIAFRRNFGKAAALDAGFAAASGEFVITMDADLQDDPQEIPNFIAKLNEGCDVVSGWKRVRNDPVHKTLPSRVFNAVVSRLSGVKLNDFNCGFKAYRAEALEGLSLYGELHRFIPVLLHWRGYRIGEIPVNHHARQFGRSKYGFNRLLKGGLDFLSVMLNTRFATRPLHVFGTAGAIFGLTGTAILAYLCVLWVLGLGPIGDRPLLMLGMLLVMTSFQFITIGLLGEFIQRQGSRADRPYTIKATLNLEHKLQTGVPAARQLAEIARRMRESHPDEQHDNSVRHDRAPYRQIQQSEPAPSPEPRPVPRRARK
ncbi:glycosyltransferase family 2 protein [Mesorhizobium sp. KR9-304]|uniref:glycosyltransferase family 2 protein n=1 Tax=Mesorhizobium sp. KR9-304 TaxID=3156614 RepID=UPI0032B49A59